MARIDQRQPMTGEQDPDHLVNILPRASRTVSTLLSGRLLNATGGEELCRIRNISATGMLVETPSPLTTGESIVVELRTGERLEGNVVWTQPGRFGVQLKAEIDVERILNQGVQRPDRRRSTRPRAPRFVASCPARITTAGGTYAATVENLSQSGVRLKMKRSLPLESPLTLNIPGLSPQRCAVRWSDGEHIGLAFLEVIPFAELSAWLSQGHGGEMISGSGDRPSGDR